MDNTKQNMIVYKMQYEQYIIQRWYNVMYYDVKTKARVENFNEPVS